MTLSVYNIKEICSGDKWRHNFLTDSEHHVSSFDMNWHK